MKIIILALCCWFFTACSSLTSTSEYQTQNDLKSTNKKTQSKSEFITNYKDIPSFKNLKYKIAPGFLFYINHPSDDKLKGKFRVDFEGILFLPYNVRINVLGKTFKQVKEEVLKAYSKFFQRGGENLDFKLLYRTYYVEVRGFVKKSGRYLVSRNEGIDKVIDKAGGLKGDLNKTFFKASLKQQNTSYSVNLNQYFQNNYYSNAFNWTGGDTIFVTTQDEGELTKSLPIVRVLGGVNTPGNIIFEQNADLFYYLSKTGGVVANLSFDNSYLMRYENGELKNIRFDLSDEETIPAIKPNDTIILQADARTRTDRALDRTSQIATILTSLLLVLIAL
jgi:protein involved in polysaccharide export with SLBB domain